MFWFFCGLKNLLILQETEKSKKISRFGAKIQQNLKFHKILKKSKTSLSNDPQPKVKLKFITRHNLACTHNKKSTEFRR